MNKITRKPIKNQYLFHCFLNIPDPRVRARCRYPLINILVITLCAILCGFNTWEGIADFGLSQTRWLNQFIDMTCGVPSPLTFARVFNC